VRERPNHEAAASSERAGQHGRRTNEQRPQHGAHRVEKGPAEERSATEAHQRKEAGEEGELKPIMQDAASSAIIAATVSLLVGGISTAWNEIRYRRQHRAESAIRKLFTVAHWKQRSFEAIKRKIGGCEDDELRRLLVRSGAIRFYHRRDNNEELWGLLSMNKEPLEE
jgi:hypothetical protein